MTVRALGGCDRCASFRVLHERESGRGSRQFRCRLADDVACLAGAGGDAETVRERRSMNSSNDRQHGIALTVTDWAAWASGLQAQDAWRQWAASPFIPAGLEVPALPEVPALQRRRIDRMGRMAIQVAWWCSEAHASGVPLVFASRHGDVQRSCELLAQLTSAESMSPTQFGLSVHNAIAALYSIVRGERGNYLALAAGRATVEAALVEAAGLLADGAAEVQVVMFEAPLPAIHADFADETDAGYAWSWRLRALGAGSRLSLTWSECADDATGAADAVALPAGLAALRFFLSGDASYEHCVDGVHWHWQCEHD